MKLPKHQRIDHKCDKCGTLHKHIDMYDEKICYGCYDKEQRG